MELYVFVNPKHRCWLVALLRPSTEVRQAFEWTAMTEEEPEVAHSEGRVLSRVAQTISLLAHLVLSPLAAVLVAVVT